MAVEQMRGCGYRKVGGLYLCGSGVPVACDRLPYELEVCPVCGAGVKFTRGWAWLNWNKYAGSHRSGAVCGDSISPFCPVCDPDKYDQPYGLIWVGEQFYTPDEFIKEALALGISRRIAVVPKNLKLGKTWVLFAHKIDKEHSEVFYTFRPQRIELLIWKSEATEEYLAELQKKNITPVVIPDGDMDHDPRTSLKPKDEEKSELEFEYMRNRIRGGNNGNR